MGQGYPTIKGKAEFNKGIFWHAKKGRPDDLRTKNHQYLKF